MANNEIHLVLEQLRLLNEKVDAIPTLSPADQEVFELMKMQFNAERASARERTETWRSIKRAVAGWAVIGALTAVGHWAWQYLINMPYEKVFTRH